MVEETGRTVLADDCLGHPKQGATIVGPAPLTWLEGGKQRIAAFTHGDGQLHENLWDGTKWQWSDLGAPAATRVTSGAGAASYDEAGKQRIWAFVLGNDGQLYARYWNGAQWQWAA